MIEERINFVSAGLKIIGILHIPANSNKKAIVMAHGITVDKDENGMFVSAARRFCEEGYTVLRFDFRGHGESEGDSVELTINDELEDLDQAVKFIKKKGFDDIGILAASFGGSIASIYTSKNKSIKALVLWNPVLNYDNVFLKPIAEWEIKNFTGKEFKESMEKYGYVIEHKGFKIGKKLFEVMKGVEPWKCLDGLYVPLLIIHGDKDTYVPYEDSKKYYKMAKTSELITIEGADHGFDSEENVKRAIEASLAWFKKWMK